MKHKRVKWIILFIVIGIVLFAGAVILVGSMGSKDKFNANAHINGIAVGGMDVQEAVSKLDTEFADAQVNLVEKEETVYSVTMSAIGFSLDQANTTSEVTNALNQQGDEFSIFFLPKEYKVSIPIVKDEETYTNNMVLSKLGGNRVKTTDAYINYNQDTENFEIVDEVQGTSIVDTQLQSYVQSELQKQFEDGDMTDTVDIVIGEDLYQVPQVKRDSEELIAQKDTLNQKSQNYHNSSITYTFGDQTEVISSDMICSWIKAEGDTIKPVKSKVMKYINSIAAKYDTVYIDRSFTTTAGKKITIPTNEYGYRIDKEAEYKQLRKDMKSGQAVTREPVYSKKGFARNGKDDLLGNYVEVSISKQHLWLYKNGKLVTQTDVVTGTDKKKTRTYKGAWTLAYKKSPYTLSSSVYDYNTTVNYWMPFVYGQGLHDASWRHGRFGGKIYKTNGSHGCVNLPPDKAKKIYETVDAGYAIIIY